MSVIESVGQSVSGAGVPVTNGEDEAILSELEAGNRLAFERMIRTYAPRLLATARRLLRNEEDAADVVQEGFLHAFQALPSFERKSSLATWLHRIVVNQALTKLRQRKWCHEVGIDDLLPSFLEDGHQRNPAVEWDESAEATAMTSETRDVVTRAVDRLPEPYRTVLVLRDLEGFDTAEVASCLHVTKGVVKTRLHRAHQALRGLLDPYFRRGDL